MSMLRGRGTDSTKEKAYADLTPGAQRARDSRERKKIVPKINKDGSVRRKPGPRVGQKQNPAVKLPDDEEKLDILKKKEDIVKLRLQNKRQQELVVEVAEFRELFNGFIDIHKQRTEAIPARFASERAEPMTKEDTVALQILHHEVVQDMRAYLENRGLLNDN